MVSRMLKKTEVLRRTSMGKTQLAEAINHGIFPKGVPIFEGGRALGWFEDEVDSYVESRRKARDAAPPQVNTQPPALTAHRAAKAAKRRRVRP